MRPDNRGSTARQSTTVSLLPRLSPWGWDLLLSSLRLSMENETYIYWFFLTSFCSYLCPLLKKTRANSKSIFYQMYLFFFRSKPFPEVVIAMVKITADVWVSYCVFEEDEMFFCLFRFSVIEHVFKWSFLTRPCPWSPKKMRWMVIQDLCRTFTYHSLQVAESMEERTSRRYGKRAVQW